MHPRIVPLQLSLHAPSEERQAAALVPLDLDDACAITTPSAAAHAGHGRGHGHLRARRRSESRAGPGPPPGPAGPAGAVAGATSTADALGLAPPEESRAFWRLVRRAFESKSSARASPSRDAGAGAGGFWANARALALVTAGPAATAALQFGLPYHSVPHRVARAFVFAFVGSIGASSNASVWFSLLLHAPLRRVVPSYMALFLVLGPSLFAASNAVVDLTHVPFGYVASLVFIVLANQICARLHARVIARRRATAASASVFAVDVVTAEAAAGGAAGSASAAAAAAASAAPVPARALSTFGKFQTLNMCIVFVLFGYLFLFSVVLINATNSSVCFLLVLLQLRAFGRPLAAALPHGDAAVLYALTMLLCVRVFRQLAFFQVQSVAVYVASLASDLATLLLPSSLLLRRVARPFARRAAAFLSRRSRAATAAVAPEEAEAGAGAEDGEGKGGAGARPAPEPPTSSHRSPSSPPSSAPAPAASAAAPSSSDHEAGPATPGSSARRGKDAPAAGPAAAAAGAEVRCLDGEEEEGAAAGGPGPDEEEEGAGAGEAPEGPAGGPTIVFDEDLWVFNVQSGIRRVVLISRCDLACASALTFSLLTAGVNGAVVAGLHAAGLLFPRLRDRLALTASWRFLREHAATLALNFSSCSSVAFLALYRQANLYYFVFPESYPPDAPGSA
eukprot:tig00001041_g6548.t1